MTLSKIINNDITTPQFGSPKKDECIKDKKKSRTVHRHHHTKYDFWKRSNLSLYFKIYLFFICFNEIKNSNLSVCVWEFTKICSICSFHSSTFSILKVTPLCFTFSIIKNSFKLRSGLSILFWLFLSIINFCFNFCQCNPNEYQ